MALCSSSQERASQKLNSQLQVIKSVCSFFAYVILAFFNDLVYTFLSERPLIVTHPISDEEVKENGQVMLSCEFCPSPRVVRWFKARTLLFGSNKYVMKREKNRVEMTIMGVKATDSGEYRCVAGGSETRGRVNVEGTELSFYSSQNLFLAGKCKRIECTC